jgi:hypothetical protein
MAFTAILGTSCGYTLRNTKDRSPVLEAAGIHKVYVQPVTNNSYKAGVEIVVYNALTKKIAAQGELKIVNHESDADAIIRSTVDSADYIIAASTSGSSLAPTNLGAAFSKYSVASIYAATLQCTFHLEPTEATVNRLKMHDNKPARTWSATFSRSQNFAASNTLGVLGTTSAIINDSEFDSTLSQISDSMMIDVNEALLGMF